MNVKNLLMALCMLVATAMDIHEERTGCYLDDLDATPMLSLLQVAGHLRLSGKPEKTAPQKERSGTSTASEPIAQAQQSGLHEQPSSFQPQEVLLQTNLAVARGDPVGLLILALLLLVPMAGVLFCCNPGLLSVLPSRRQGVGGTAEAPKPVMRPDWAAPIPPATRAGGTQSPNLQSAESSASSVSLSGRGGTVSSLPADVGGPLCPSLRFDEPRVISFSGDLMPQPQDVVVNITDESGAQLARAYAHETGLSDPGIVLEAEGFGYFAFLDTSNCGAHLPDSQRRILVRRATNTSVSGAAYAVLASSTVNGGRVLVARALTGEALFRVQIDMLGRIVEVRDGQTRQVAQMAEPRRTDNVQGSPSSAGSPNCFQRTGVCLQVLAGADNGLLLSAILGAQKLR